MNKNPAYKVGDRVEVYAEETGDHIQWLREHHGTTGVVEVVNPEPYPEGVFLPRGTDGTDVLYELAMDDGTIEQVHERMLTLRHYCGEIEGERDVAAFPCGLPATDSVIANNGWRVHLCSTHLTACKTGGVQ